MVFDFGFQFDKCVLCMEEPANSKEHIIPSCIGGCVESHLLCVSCNNKCGTELISRIPKDPSIRLAMENLKNELPDLYRETAEGRTFIYKTPEKVPLKFLCKNGKLRIVEEEDRNGNRFKDISNARKELQKGLIRKNFTESQKEECMKLFDTLEEEVPKDFPDGKTYIKRCIADFRGMEPNLDEKLFDGRIPALIAYEFLAVRIGNAIYGGHFDDIRSYIKGGRISDKHRVERKTTRKYAPVHWLAILPREKFFTVKVSFFNWLVYEVYFNGFNLPLPDIVYRLDLKERESFISIYEGDQRKGCVNLKWLKEEIEKLT